MPADPPRTPRNAHVVARRVAPFAPLAVSMLAAHGLHAPSTASAAGAESSALESTADLTPQRCDNVTDILDCHDRYPTGCSLVGGRYDPYLNLMKNELIQPTTSVAAVKVLAQSDFQSLDAGTPTDFSDQLAEEDQLTALGEGSTVGIIGYLYYAKVSGPETSNCQIGKGGGTKDDGNFDYHIGIGFDADTARSVRDGSADQKQLGQQSIIVEMTPHYRSHFESGVWTFGNLQAVLGRQVEVVGQLLADTEHNKPAQNCAIAQTTKEQSSCWRASIWELHPVTAFLVCVDTANTCRAGGTGWVPLADAANNSQ